MFALGVLSIVQAAFLPGFVGVLLLRLGGGLLRTLVLSFTLSVLLNYLLMLALCAAGLYSRGALGAAVVIELAAAAWLLRVRGAPPGLALDLERARALLAAVASRPGPRRAVAALVILTGIVAAGDVVAASWTTAGKVFSGWDAVVSWNRWAIEWATLGWPTSVWTYPQLLPAAYATTYTFIGTTDVQFFARAIAGLFPLAMAAALADMTLRTGHLRYLAAMSLSVPAVRAILVGEPGSGYADEPVAALLVIASCLLVSADDEPARRGAWLTGAALAAAAAAATKQTAWVFVALLPVTAWCIVGRGLERRRAMLTGIGVTIPALLAVGPWYAWLALNPPTWGLSYVLSGVHGDRTLLERAQFALANAAHGYKIPAAVLVAAAAGLLALSLVDRRWRWIGLLGAAPMLAFWALALGYDTRNGTPAVALLVVSGVVGLGTLCQLGASRVEARPVLGYAALAALFLGSIVALGKARFTAANIERWSGQQSSGAFRADINRLIYDLVAQRRAGGIVTNYQVLKFLPHIGGLYRFHPLTVDHGLDAMLDDPANTHVLYHTFTRLSEPLTLRQQRARLVQIAEGRNYYLFRIERGIPSESPESAAGAGATR
jgi:hypothetical protein